MPALVEYPPVTGERRRQFEEFYLGYRLTIQVYLASLMTFEHTPEDIEDVASMVWLKAWRMWGNYDEAKGPGSPKAWTKTLAYRMFVDWYRAKKSRLGAVSMSQPVGSDSEFTLEQVLANQLQAEPVQDDAVHPRVKLAADIVLRLVSSRQAEAIRYRLAGLEDAEIAERLGCTPPAVRKLVWDAHRTARVQLVRRGVTSERQLLLWDKVIV